MIDLTRNGSAVVTLPTDTEILITREFAAPELVKRWWSGHQGMMTSVEIDLRVGGRWRYVMAANDGSEVAFHGHYREIVPNERIVTTEVYEMPGADSPPESAVPLNVITFTETDGRTALRLLVQCPTRELRDMIINSGMEVGMQEQLDVLEQVANSLGGAAR